jgi:hypothetical protein
VYSLLKIITFVKSGRMRLEDHRPSCTILVGKIEIKREHLGNLGVDGVVGFPT